MMMMRRRRRSRQLQYGACTRRLDQLLTISSGLLCCSPSAAWSGLLRQIIIPSSSSLGVPLSTSSSTEATGGGGFAAAGNDQQQQQPPLGTADVLLPSSQEILFQHQDVVRAETPQVAAAAAEEVVIAIGGNIGDRVQNFNKALEFMRNSGIQVIRHACLYESAPAYVTDQPVFLNSAVAARTKLDPHALLSTLKQIESELGRASGGIRYGPRPLDLDIIFYGDKTVDTEKLQIPHARFMERPFVLAPLVDLARPASSDVPGHWLRHSTVNKGGIANAWNQMGGEACVGKEGLRRVIPVGSKLLDWATRTHVMGILNVTPDSFSDGGRYLSVDDAVRHARRLAADGADFIDIGAQSTRPGATRLSTDEELSRLLPVLDALARDPALDGVDLSVDTFDSRVVREAVSRGVKIVNDVSGGCLDPEMLSTVAELGVPYIMMHMRGDPTTMQNKANTSYGDDVCYEIGQELQVQLQRAEDAGIPAWRIIIDPGIGFAKTADQNLEVLRNLPAVRKALSEGSPANAHGPLLVGASRKSFLGKICGHKKGEERDAATIAATVVGVIGGANIVRVHNVQAVHDAVRVVDAIYKHRPATIHT
ncbi:unnamed protein product [Sphagnum jensenii]|uniref:Pterin-binding domain-containing protein n=1 Tax=Sphagnum jensenii TaxID=128206 RepID=A0ABP1BEJ9_9BRYO